MRVPEYLPSQMSLGDFDEILLGNTARDLCGFVSWRRVGRFVLT